MIEIILKRLIIAAGQWNQFGEQQYALEFERGLQELQQATGITHETAVDMLINYIQGAGTI